MRKVEINSELRGNIKMFVVAMLISIFACSVCLLLVAFLMDKLPFTEQILNGIVSGIHLFSAFCAGLVAGKWKKTRRFAWGIWAGIFWYVAVFLIASILPEKAMDVSRLFPILMCSLGGGMLGGMFSRNIF